jgi:hypothetical protein
LGRQTTGRIHGHGRQRWGCLRCRLKAVGFAAVKREVLDIWIGLDLGRQRAVIDCLMTIVVLPATKRGEGFDSERVTFEWKQ